MLCKYNKYPATKVNNKVIVHTYLPAQIPLADFKWRMAIFIVILANHSYGFYHHLVHFRPLFSAPSIGKTGLKNSSVLEPFKKSLLTTANSCQDFFYFRVCSSLHTTILLGSPVYPLSPTIHSPSLILK